MLTIEDNVPVPANLSPKVAPGPIKSELTVKLLAMSPGQSVFVPCERRADHNSVYVTLRRARNYRGEGRQFVNESQEGGIRIWRV